MQYILSAYERLAIKTLWDTGNFGLRQLAADYNVSTTTIRAIIDGKAIPPKRSRKKLTQLDVLRAIDMRNAGHRLKNIAAWFNVSQATLSREMHLYLIRREGYGE